jgi:hypothetical protein
VGLGKSEEILNLFFGSKKTFTYVKIHYSHDQLKTEKKVSTCVRSSDIVLETQKYKIQQP